MRIDRLGYLLTTNVVGGLLLSVWLTFLSPSASGGSRLTFIREWVVGVPFLLSLISAALLLPLTIFAFIKLRQAAPALAVCFTISASTYMCALVLLFPFGLMMSDTWEVEHTLRGSDGHTYYLLHASPPLHGAGHSSIARRTGGSPFYYTMQLITKEDYIGLREWRLLDAARKDPDPEVQRVAADLLKTLKRQNRQARLAER